MTIQCPRNLQPRGTLDGTLQWQFDRPVRSITLSLLWHTIGKGTEDVEIVAKETIDGPNIAGTRKFSFQLPPGPYSFSGKLISLQWVGSSRVDLQACKLEYSIVSPK